MQLGSLKVFCDVARCRSFSQAGAANDITQSAVSHIVSQLEQRMDVQLIDRSVRPLQLTPLGQQYYEGCKALLDQYDELEASIRSSREELAGTVRVAAIYSVGLGDVGDVVEALHRVAAGDGRARRVSPSGSGLRACARGNRRLRSGVVPAEVDEVIGPALRSNEEMVLVCSPNDPLARLDALTPRRTRRSQVRPFRSGPDGAAEDRSVSQRARSDARKWFTSSTTSRTSSKRSRSASALALLPMPTVRREVRNGTLVALPLRRLPVRAAARDRDETRPSTRFDGAPLSGACFRRKATRPAPWAEIRPESPSPESPRTMLGTALGTAPERHSHQSLNSPSTAREDRMSIPRAGG